MKKLFVCLVTVFLMVLSVAPAVFAADAGYTTDRFDVDIEVKENHVFHVTETINVDFRESRHGIFRYIPYDLGKYKISNIHVEDDTFQVETQSENGVNQKIIRIGDEGRTINGEHIYKISYDIVAYEDKIPDVDYLALDLIPTGWETAIKASEIRVNFPKSINPDKLQIYSGRYGVAGNDYNIKADYDDETKSLFIETKDLMQGVGINIYSELPQGYWVDAASRDWMVKPLIVLLVALPVLMAVLWFLFGRDPKIVKTVEFYPPEGMTPAEIGYIIDGTVDTKDITSLIIYYASKGWLSINEYEKDKFEVTKLAEIDRNEKSFTRTIFNALFEEKDSVELTKLPASFGEMVMVGKSQLRGHYRRDNALFTSSSKLCRSIGMGLMFLPAVGAVLAAALISFNYMYNIMLLPVMAFLVIGLFMLIVTFDKKETYRKGKFLLLMLIASASIFIGSAAAGITLALAVNIGIFAVLVVASMIVTFVFVLLMHKRTEKSAKWQGQILGFRNFIETAELDKLNMLVEENPEYFYNIMPYAYVMGLSDKWAKNFENIPMSAPSWYYGDTGNTVFNTYWYMHMFNHCTRTFTSSTVTSMAGGLDIGGGNSTSSIGGGFGGGGFSGGGFGGGGGGSW